MKYLHRLIIYRGVESVCELSYLNWSQLETQTDDHKALYELIFHTHTQPGRHNTAASI